MVKSPAKRLVPALLLIAGLTAPASALGSERDIKFTNATGSDVDDLHILFSLHTTTKDKGPFAGDKTHGTNSTTHNYYGHTVKHDGSADATVTLKFTSLADTLTIGSWWWTVGGTANMDGTMTGGEKKDTGGRELSFVGPATGDGSIAVAINGASHVFGTTPGDTAVQSATAFDSFLDGLLDGGFALVSSTLVSPTQDVFVGNLLGNPTTELSVSVLRRDSTQAFYLAPLIPEPSSFALLGLGVAGLLWRRGAPSG